MTCPLIAELAVSGFDITVVCRVLGVARSSYYALQQRAAGPSARDWEEAALTDVIVDIHGASRGSYGAPRVHAELTLGLGLAVNKKRTARLLKAAGRHGISAPRKSRRSRPAPAVHEDLVQRRFTADGPDRIWCTDIERHEALSNRVGVGDLHRRAVAAAW